MPLSASQLTDFIQEQFRALADPSKAGPMQAYVKTEMPFYGIQTPGRMPVYREMTRRFVPVTRREYEAGVRALWGLPHREEKYAALAFAGRHERFITSESLPLYEALIREGAWWDLVDGVAIDMVGRTLLTERAVVRPIIERWIDDEDMWIRRTALIAHNSHKKRTDRKQLFAHCLKRAHEKEFFIRKAIGWALREYSYSEPAEVCDFLTANRARLSGLSYREGIKQLVSTGAMPKD
jgi:3-methyladenine DNA glycosylase AlkD